MTVSAAKNGSADFALQKGVVRWSDISLYQGEQLLPDAPGAPNFSGPALPATGLNPAWRR